MKAKVRNPERRLRIIAITGYIMLACACRGDALDTDLDRDGWLQCDTDNDCAPVFLSCHGWTAARADRETEILTWYLRTNDRALSVRDCPGRGDMPRPLAVCRTNRCEVRTTSTP